MIWPQRAAAVPAVDGCVAYTVQYISLISHASPVLQAKLKTLPVGSAFFPLQQVLYQQQQQQQAEAVATCLSTAK